MYRSLVKECPWAEHLISLPKWGVGTLLSVSAFNYERAPMSCLRALEANNWTNLQPTCTTEPPAALKSSSDDTQLSEQHHDCELGVAHGVRHISYVRSCKGACSNVR